MDIASEVADYLEDAGFGTVGTDIFIGQMPDETNGIWLERSSGSMANYVPVENPVVDIYVKDTSAADAMTLIENIKRFIHRMHNTSTANSYIYSMLVLSDVETVMRDLEYAKIFKISVQIMHRDTGVIS